LEAETNKYCPGGYDIGAISNLITWVLNFFLSAKEGLVRIQYKCLVPIYVFPEMKQRGLVISKHNCNVLLHMSTFMYH
jgi:hypothetical protein